MLSQVIQLNEEKDRASDQLPADGHGERLRRAGTGADDLWPQTSGLEDVEERITGGYGP